jgi:hypothetical protein
MKHFILSKQYKMQNSLSDADIKKYIPNVIIYDELNNLKKISLPLVILYRTADNFGHWVLLHRTPEGVEFFDSYGEIPDTQFNKIPPRFQRPHYLTALLKDLNSSFQIHYNDYPLQGILSSTCGRWVILRHLLSYAPIDVFNSSVIEVSKNLDLTPDQLVTQIIH